MYGCNACCSRFEWSDSRVWCKRFVQLHCKTRTKTVCFASKIRDARRSCLGACIPPVYQLHKRDFLHVHMYITTYLHVYHMYISYIVNTYKSFSSLFQAFIRKAFFIEKVCWRFGFFAVGLNGNFWVRPPVTRLNENEHKEKWVCQKHMEIIFKSVSSVSKKKHFYFNKTKNPLCFSLQNRDARL